MNPFKDLKPELIWKFFHEITQVPRPSKKEAKIIAYLIDFAKNHNLEYAQDKTGNILIKKPATLGKESSPTVILQAHMDMVCEKNSDTEFDFDNDPINAYIDGDWVTAKGTTLGGDDGIGMAAELALLASSDVAHPALECLFTVDEETGMTGAFGLEEGFLSGKTLINLDSEDDAEVYVGCAGGIDTLINFEYESQEVPQNYEAVKITVNGLSGGHSGGDIHLNRGNANKILAQLIAEEASKYDIRLALFDGGNLRNAIPREAYCIVAVAETQEMVLMKNLNDFVTRIQTEFATSDPNVNLTSEACDKPETVIDPTTQMQLINAINSCPNGVIAMSKSIDDLVETSTNLASVKIPKEGTIEVVTSQRSSCENAKKDIAQRIRDNFETQGATVTQSDGYPGWAPNMDSNILKVSQEAFKTLHNEEPAIKAIHAGLECGLFLQKYPYLDMISIGPTLIGVHSPDEKMNIKDVERFWNWLVEILKNI